MRDYDPDVDSVYLVNLQEEAISKLRTEKRYVDRMPGGSKIHIIIDDLAQN